MQTADFPQAPAPFPANNSAVRMWEVVRIFENRLTLSRRIMIPMKTFIIARFLFFLK